MAGLPAALDDQPFIDALLDVLLPPAAAGDVPGAGALGLAPAVAASVRADRLLGPALEAGLQALREAALSQHAGGLPGMAPEAATKFVEARLSANPLLMMGLLRHVYPAYYAHPLALAGIGEPPRPPFPEGFEVEATDPALLEELRARRQKQ
jgi:hypothetical protein